MPKIRGIEVSIIVHICRKSVYTQKIRLSSTPAKIYSHSAQFVVVVIRVGVRTNILTVYVHCVVVFCCGAGVRMNILTVFVQCVVVVDVVQGSG